MFLVKYANKLYAYFLDDFIAFRTQTDTPLFLLNKCR